MYKEFVQNAAHIWLYINGYLRHFKYNTYEICPENLIYHVLHLTFLIARCKEMTINIICSEISQLIYFARTFKWKFSVSRKFFR
jgi:hypothetical protein